MSSLWLFDFESVSKYLDNVKSRRKIESLLTFLIIAGIMLILCLGITYFVAVEWAADYIHTSQYRQLFKNTIIFVMITVIILTLVIMIIAIYIGYRLYIWNKHGSAMNSAAKAKKKKRKSSYGNQTRRRKQ